MCARAGVQRIVLSNSYVLDDFLLFVSQFDIFVRPSNRNDASNKFMSMMRNESFETLNINCVCVYVRKISTIK